MRLFELYNNQLITYYENSNLPMNIILELLNLKKSYDIYTANMPVMMLRALKKGRFISDRNEYLFHICRSNDDRGAFINKR